MWRKSSFQGLSDRTRSLKTCIHQQPKWLAAKDWSTFSFQKGLNKKQSMVHEIRWLREIGQFLLEFWKGKWSLRKMEDWRTSDLLSKGSDWYVPDQIFQYLFSLFTISFKLFVIGFKYRWTIESDYLMNELQHFFKTNESHLNWPRNFKRWDTDSYFCPRNALKHDDWYKPM